MTKKSVLLAVLPTSKHLLCACARALCIHTIQGRWQEMFQGRNHNMGAQHNFLRLKYFQKHKVSLFTQVFHWLNYS